MSGDFWRTPGYINDLPGNVQSLARLSADYALLHSHVASDADCHPLQSELRMLEYWQYHWQMEFNPPQRKYVFCGVELEQVDSFPYLGVTISNKLK